MQFDDIRTEPLERTTVLEGGTEGVSKLLVMKLALIVGSPTPGGITVVVDRGELLPARQWDIDAQVPPEKDTYFYWLDVPASGLADLRVELPGDPACTYRIAWALLDLT